MTHVKACEGTRIVGNSERYGLSISTIINEANPITAEIRHINEAMVNWLRARKGQCESLTIVYGARPELQDDIVHETRRLVEQDLPEAKEIRQMTVNVVFHDGDRIYRQLVLKNQPDQ